MDPLMELTHLKFTGKTDGRRHVAKFEKLVHNAYPHATDTAKWSLFLKTIDNNTRSNSREGGPAEWLRDISKTEMWKSGRFSYQQLRSAFLDRWSRSHRSESAALVPMTIQVNSGRRERHHREDSHSRERRSSDDQYHDMGPRQKAYHSNSQKDTNQIVLTFPGPSPDLKKRRKFDSFHGVGPDQPNPLAPHSPGSYNPMEPIYIPDSPQSRDYAQPAIHQAVHPSMQQQQQQQPQPQMIQQQQMQPQMLPQQMQPQMQPQMQIPMQMQIPQQQQMQMQMQMPPQMQIPPQMQPRDVMIVDREDYHHRPSPHASSAQSSARESPEPSVAGGGSGGGPRRLLEGKVCLITGATSAIGEVLARGFALEGAHLMLQYNADPASPVNDEIVSLCVEIRSSGQGCNVISGDLSDPKTSDLIVKRCLDVYGRIDIMVGNIEMTCEQDFLQVTAESLAEQQKSNQTGTFLLCQAVARQMSEQTKSLARGEPKPDHSIVCIASAAGVTSLQQMSQLAPTRAGVVSLMQQCAASLGKFGVRCNTILPGPMDIQDSRAERDAVDRVPLGRIGTPEDLVGPAVFLASGMSRYVSGTQVVVDGGALLS